MEEVFVDTAFWIARIHPRDNLHEAAKKWSQVCVKYPLVTSDAVLGELETFFAEKGPELRQMISKYIEQLENDPNLTIVPDNREIVRRARQLYASRPDKGYSSVDCKSMVLMKERGMRLVLTSDEHFDQEGFIALLRKTPGDAQAFLT
jgi:predicted nucleic acid-binding protein